VADCLSVRVYKEISKMVRPRTIFRLKTSYICMQIKFISNFGYHAPFANKVRNMIALAINKLEI